MTESRSLGFTLVELMLVIVLISVMTALTAPRFRRTASEFELKNAAFNLYHVVQFARERAFIEGREFRIHFDYDKKDYRLLAGPDPTQPLRREAEFKPVEGRFGKKIRLAQELSLEGRQNDLTCSPDGNCDVATFRIRNQEGAYEIAVENLGGVIRLREVSQ